MHAIRTVPSASVFSRASKASGLAELLEQFLHRRSRQWIDHVVGREEMVRGVAQHSSAQQFVVTDEGVPLQLLGPAGPTAAQHDLAFVGKEICRLYGSDEHHVVVEVKEAIGQTIDAPQHGFDRQRVEGREQFLMAAKNLTVIDNTNIVLLGLATIDR
jgi:hypothetical protein